MMHVWIVEEGVDGESLLDSEIRGVFLTSNAAKDIYADKSDAWTWAGGDDLGWWSPRYKEPPNRWGRPPVLIEMHEVGP